MDFKTRTQQMRDLLDAIMLAARTDQTILLSGESGTGKEVIANYIHQCSGRADKPFVKVDCTAIPYDLWESELFGYLPGAFTGASQRGKAGKFDLADGGTLLLDEIGEVPLALQAKLLRVLQDRTYEPVGGVRAHQVNVRIIATTNRDLSKLRQAGQFREDLFYRLNQFSFKIPPLRERKEDIELLVQHFMERAGAAGVTPAAMSAMLLYGWPGNVRELENAISRAVVLASGEGQIDVKHLPPDVAGIVPVSSSGGIYKRHMRAAERMLVQWALEACGQDRTRAARFLGISRAALYKKLNLYPELKGDGE